MGWRSPARGHPKTVGTGLRGCPVAFSQRVHWEEGRGELVDGEVTIINRTLLYLSLSALVGAVQSRNLGVKSDTNADCQMYVPGPRKCAQLRLRLMRPTRQTLQHPSELRLRPPGGDDNSADLVLMDSRVLTSVT